MNGLIYFVERNIHGAIVIYGAIGVKQYYFYKEREAKRRYIEECKKTIFVNAR